MTEIPYKSSNHFTSTRRSIDNMKGKFMLKPEPIKNFGEQFSQPIGYENSGSTANLL